MITLIITVKTIPEPESYSRWEDLDQPECPYCHAEMVEVPDDSEYYEEDIENLDVGEELWVCQFCGEVQSYRFGQYGEREIEITKEDFEAEESKDRQEAWLYKRYGTNHPTSICDYWINRIG